MTLHIDFHEIGFAAGLNVIEAFDFHFNRFVPHQSVAETIIARVEGRALKRRKRVRSAERALKSNNVCRAIDRAILAEDREKIWFGLEGHDGAASAHQLGEQERIKTDVRADVDDLHARPNESPQQDRLIFTHPTEPVQTEVNQPVQRGGAHPALPNIDLPLPEQGVIEFVKQGQNHFSRPAQLRLDKVGAELIGQFARAQATLNQFDFGNRKQKHPQQQHSVSPALDVSVAVSAIAIADRDITDFEMEMIRAENQIEIAKWIEIAEVRAIRRDALVVVFP